MKNKLAQQIVSPTTSDVHSYSPIIALLKDGYENKREIFIKRHFKVLRDATGYYLNHEDVANLKALWEKHLTGLQSTGQYGAEYLMTAVAILNMKPKMYAEWSKFIKGHVDLPSISIYKDFLKELSRTLRRDAEDERQLFIPIKKNSSLAMIHLADETTQCGLCRDAFYPLYLC